MEAIWGWLRDAVSEIFARSIAYVILGGFIAAVGGLLSYGISKFLLQQVQVPVALLVILSLFASVGLLAGISPLWAFVSSRRNRPQPQADDRLESSTSAILRQLTKVETGKQIYAEHQIKDFHAATLSLFDEWEVQVKRYLPTEAWPALSALREEIAGRSLQHSRTEAKDWITRVKALSDNARAIIR